MFYNLLLLPFLLHMISCVPLSHDEVTSLRLIREIYNIDNLNDDIIYDEIQNQLVAEYHALDPEISMNVNEIIQYHGYPVEDHVVQTEDGYKITMQRIPYGKKDNSTKSRVPVLLLHGLMCSSAVWVINTPDKNLAYILAENGYDVWLGNVRGTLYGLEHTKLTPESVDFWEFSFDEMAKYDLPVMIDKVLDVTKFKQLHYVGHSMGNTIAMALLSTQPKYNDKIKTLFALAPIATLNHVRSPIKYLAPISHQAAWLLNLIGLGNGEFLANNKFHKFLTKTVCNSPLKVLCESVIFLLCGYDRSQLNSTRLPVFLHHTPAATSVRNLMHLAQIVQSTRFQQYDYGSTINKQKYGQKTAPVYNLTDITAPVALFWGDNDYLADPNDVSWLAKQISSLKLKYRVPYDKFSHLDFMWANDIKVLLYNKLLNYMDEFWKE